VIKNVLKRRINVDELQILENGILRSNFKRLANCFS
jgi:hypothetical protein